MKNNTYGIDIQKAHENLYFKKFKVNEFGKELVKELKLSKVYGKGPHAFYLYDQYGRTDPIYYIYTIKNNQLLQIWVRTIYVGFNTVRYRSRLSRKSKIEIHIKSLCEKNNKNKILFDVLDLCKSAEIENIIVSNKQATVTFDFANRDSIKAICNKYNNVTYANIPSVRKKRCGFTIKFDKPINEYSYIFDFDFK